MTVRKKVRLVLGLVALAVVLAACSTSSSLPQNSLDPQGPYARKIDNLFNPVFWIAVVVFVLVEGAPWLVLSSALLRWTAAGYADRAIRPTRRRAVVITPPSLVKVLRAGWRPLVPLLHPSAQATAT